MFYWVFRRYLHRFFREVFEREVIVSGCLKVVPLLSRSTTD
jgi:hypothetical protein